MKMKPKKIGPYHSKEEDTKVYHIYRKCFEGNNIEKKNKIRGTGGLRLCKRCGKMH